jgi:Leucine-rich repeat (LRR) protein
LVKTIDEIYGNQDSWGDFLYYRFGNSPMFPIQDRNAKIVFKPKFLIDDMTNARNSAITHLDWSNQNLEDISDLVNYPKLSELDLRNNTISDITVLVALTELRSLALQHNKIKDIHPLFALKKLEFVNLSHNYVSVADQELLEKTLPECMFGF